MKYLYIILFTFIWTLGSSQAISHNDLYTLQFKKDGLVDTLVTIKNGYQLVSSYQDSEDLISLLYVDPFELKEGFFTFWFVVFLRDNDKWRNDQYRFGSHELFLDLNYPQILNCLRLDSLTELTCFRDDRPLERVHLNEKFSERLISKIPKGTY